MNINPDENRDTTSMGSSTCAHFERLAEGGFHARVAASPGLAVVLFTAPGCGACRAWKQLLPAALCQRAQRLYEVDVSEASGVAHGFGIFHLPTIYLYRDGQFHAELQCEAHPDAIQRTVSHLMDSAAQEEP
jgi:thioredoxin-like negative regulator of GroEL